MKKLFLISMMCLMALSMHAQRCAVLDFQVGTGVTEEDIEGISYNFRSSFHPNGYIMLERVMINRTIDEMTYTRTDMTMSQMLKVGRNLDASVIVVGTMNKFMDEYSVDIRVINVSTGATSASENATFVRADYRTSMQNLADKLASKMDSGTSGIDTPRPAVSSQGYVDLGLPSGTKWRSYNATGLYTQQDAVNSFGDRLPSKAQWVELTVECRWEWTGKGYKVTGPNGNSIDLPAEGYLCGGERKNVSVEGHYRSKTTSSNSAWVMKFESNLIKMGDHYREDCGFSVRLVQN